MSLTKFYDENKDALTKSLAGSSIIGPYTDSELTDLISQAQNTLDINEPKSITDRRNQLGGNAGTLSSVSNTNTVNNSQTQADAENKRAQDFQALLNFNSSAEEDPIVESAGTPRTPSIVGTHAFEDMLTDRKKMQEGRLWATGEMLKLDSASNAVERWWNNLKYADSERISKQEAEAYYKSLGIDLKEKEEGVSYYEMKRKADEAIRRQELNRALAIYHNTRDISALNKAQIFGTSLVTGMFASPLDTGATIASFVIPELAVGTVSRIGGVMSNALKTERVLNAAMKVNRARVGASIMEAGLSAADDAARLAASPFLRGKAYLNNKTVLETARIIENVKSWNYVGMSAGSKTLLDAFTWGVIDIPQAIIKKNYAEETGLYQYTGKDMIQEMLTAGALGTVLPGSLRLVGKALGIQPREMFVRKINEVENRIKTDVALGKITKMEGDIRLAETDKLKKNMNTMFNQFKQPHPIIQEVVDSLEKTNITTEELQANIRVALEMFRAGQVPTVLDLPFSRHALSHVSAELLNKLLDMNTRLQDVFGSNLGVEVSGSGLVRVKVNGDEGLLGRRAVFSFNKEEAEQMMKDLYKGFILEDPKNEEAKALAAFKTKVARQIELYNTLRETVNKWEEAHRKKSMRAKYQGYTDVNVKERFKKAYIKYLGGKGALALYEKNLDVMRVQKEKGYEPRGINIDSIEDIIKQADAFANKYTHTPQRYSNQPRFIDDKGNDSVANIEKVLSDVREGLEGNIELAKTNEFLSDMEEERLANYFNKLENLEVSEDTTLNKFFGMNRVGYESLNDLDKEADAWASLTAREEINFNEKIKLEDKKAKEASESTKMIKNYSTKPSNGVAVINKRINGIPLVNDLMSNKYALIKTRFIEQFRTSSAFKKIGEHIDALAQGGGTRFIKLSVKDAVLGAINKTRLGDFITTYNDRIKSVVVNRVTDVIMKQIEKDPSFLQALKRLDDLEKANPNIKGRTKIDLAGHQSTIEDLKKVLPEQETEGSTQLSFVASEENYIKDTQAKISEEAKIISEVQAQMQMFFAPIEKTLDIEMNRLKLQMMNDLQIADTNMQLCLEHPELASEILTANSTQTVYDFHGSKRNFEYIRRTARLYENDLINTINAYDRQNGTNLMAYYKNEDNGNDIRKAILNIQHGIDTKGNSEAELLAKMIMDQQATISKSFSKFGSLFLPKVNFIKKGKLKYADAIMSEPDINDLANKFTIINSDPLQKGPYDVKEILNKMKIENSDEYRYGLQTMLVEEATNKVKDALESIHKDLQSLFGIENNADKKIVLWALRDFNLDEMFDRSGDMARFGFNEIRDALLEGRLDKIIGNDFYNLYCIKADIATLKSKIVGKEFDGVEVDPVSWLGNYKAGFNNLGTVCDGTRSAYLDSIDAAIHFKNVDTEMNAINLFGYDTLQQALVKSYDDSCKALASLELFGSNPVGLVTDIISTYENARKSNSGLRRRLKLLAESTNSNVNRYEITPAQAKSIIDHVKNANGLMEQAPSDGIRLAQIIQRLLSTPLLAKASLKSISDHATIWESMAINEMMSRREAMGTMLRVQQALFNNPELIRPLIASTVIEVDNISRFITGGSMMDLNRLSENVTRLDKLEEFSKKLSNGFLEHVTRMGSLTNANKQKAAATMQTAIAKYADYSWDELKKMNFNMSNEGLDRYDWDLMRKYMIMDLSQVTKDGGGKWDFFSPFKTGDIPDEAIQKALEARGKKNISKTDIEYYRRQLQSKCFTLINSPADEAISMPSERVMRWLRFGQVKGSWQAFGAEFLTQFQAFPFAMAYNIYGKKTAHAVRGMSGITCIDMFNPMSKVAWAEKAKLYGSLLYAAAELGVTMAVVDSTVDALGGKVEKLVLDDGSINTDFIIRKAAAPLGPLGTIADTFIGGIDASGQKGGGFSIQAAPAGSNLLRMMYRQNKIWSSSKIENKPAASAFEFTNEAARFTGLKTLPIIAPIFQAGIGSYLDVGELGGYQNYYENLEKRRKRGIVISPWEENPTWLMDKLQGY